MIVLVAIIGLVLGNILNLLIAHQAVGDGGKPSGRAAIIDWFPVAGSLLRSQWVALAVELLTAVLAVTLYLRYDFSVRSLYLLGASLILIDTGAVDFKIRMIDTLVMVVATLAALILAPLNDLNWFLSLSGLLLAGILFLFFYFLAKLLFPGVAAPFGLGDVYLAAFIGALVGILELPVALFWGMLMAGAVALGLIIVRATGRKIPTYLAYGTYLCLGTLLFLAVGP